MVGSILQRLIVIMDFPFAVRISNSQKAIHVINSSSDKFRYPFLMLTYFNIQKRPTTNPSATYFDSYKIWYNLSRNKRFCLSEFCLLFVLRGIIFETTKTSYLIGKKKEKQKFKISLSRLLSGLQSSRSASQETMITAKS